MVAFDVERYYKNPVNATTLYVRVEGGTIGIQGVWVEDQPEFTVGERVLVFLASTDQTHLEQPLYIVPGLIQGKFTVIGDTAHAPGGPYLRISETEITLIPDGSIELAELVIPGNRTIFEDIYGTVGFTNPGGQGASGNVSITFTGVQGPCEGYVNTTTFWIGVGPGGYTGRELRLNFAARPIHGHRERRTRRQLHHPRGRLHEQRLQVQRPNRGAHRTRSRPTDQGDADGVHDPEGANRVLLLDEDQADRGSGRPHEPTKHIHDVRDLPRRRRHQLVRVPRRDPRHLQGDRLAQRHKGTAGHHTRGRSPAELSTGKPADGIPGHPAAATLLGIVTAYITLKRLKPSQHI